ncbi:MAG: glutamate ABC transporter substrate-binding protein [Acidimicrobiales bacterium]
MTVAPIRRMVAAALAAACLLGVTACGGDATLPAEVEGQVPETTTTVAPTQPECTDAQLAESPTRTYPPLDPMPEEAAADMPAMPIGSTMHDIQEKGYLTVGVSGDTLLFGSRNPLTDQIEGFDIDVLKEVAKAIFGDDGEDKIVYRVITYAQRLPSLESGDVDIVAHTMTINCRRWLRIAFSSVYYLAGQKVLVQKDSGFDSIDALNDASARVCAPEGSTNIDYLRDPENELDGIEVIGKADITDCLVAMQQGEADATTGDDTVLAGFAAQDPSTEVVGDPFTEEPYGLGMSLNPDRVDFVEFVNGVLERIRANGRLDEINQDWLVDTGALKPDQITPVPAPDYTRPLP